MREVLNNDGFNSLRMTMMKFYEHVFSLAYSKNKHTKILIKACIIFNKIASVNSKSNDINILP